MALTRTLSFLFSLIKVKPRVALIFCSDGASAIEKGFMVVFCKIFGVDSLIFPRAGNLIEQTKNSIFYRRLIKFLFRNSKIFLAQGKHWKSFAEKQLDILPTKIKLVHNWTATPELLNIGANRKYKYDQNISHFLFVGWLEKEKGLNEILKSIELLNKKKYTFMFTFIGDGRGMNFAKKFIYEKELENSVVFRGWVKPQYVKEYYREADVFVLPSWAEGMPNALIEALSCGLATIVSNVGMITNYLVNEENALIVKPNDSKSLTKSMERLLVDKDLKINISKNGYKVANKYFSTEKQLRSLASSIKQLI